MVLGFNLDNWKSSLNESFQAYVQTPLEQSTANFTKLAEDKANEFKELVKENMERGRRTQQALIAIALAIFLLLAIAYFWKD